MCGIVGVLLGDGNGIVEGALIREMRDLLRHRGPDDAGEFLQGPVGLGHRRLKIIDLETGRQPLANEDGTIQVVYNGEIYNFQELRQRAERAGHRFATRTDTEVIVHLYEEVGERVVEFLDGMFAFAVWDGRRRLLFLARDRAGVKPLYYAYHNGSFAFASEIPPLLLLPWVSRTIDPAALDSYLSRGYVPAPRTLLRDVFKLPAAHRLLVSAKGLKAERYWSPDPPARTKMSVDDLEAELLAELDRAIRTHVVSDVPLGAFLSGGLDSSIVVTLLRRHFTGRLKTFSLGIRGGRDFDESSHAETVARHLQTEHHAVTFDAADMPELLVAAARFLDEPVSEPAAVPTYVLAKLARESVTVVLTGEGADETWGGYDVFRKGQVVANYRRLPDWLRRSVTDPMLRRVPIWRAGARLVDASRSAPYMARLTHLDRDARLALYSEDGVAAIAAQEEDECAGLAPTDPFGSISRDLLDSHLAERLLFKVDRMTMAHSLEARVPFLDHHLVEFAFSVPSRLKLRGRTTKYLLRRAFRDQLPSHISERGKHGFNIPCSAWLRSTLAPLVTNLFEDPTMSPLIDAARLRQLWKRHLMGEVDAGVQIWALMTLELWSRTIRYA